MSPALAEAAGARQVVLGLGEWRVTNDPNEVLVCLGLGSCVALCLHDRVAQVGGMAHMVLPDSAAGRPGAALAKFVDLAVPMLFEHVLAAGANGSSVDVAVAGGASMLAGSTFARQAQVGDRNVQAARDALTGGRFRAHREDAGGQRGRTVHLHIGSGMVTVAYAGETARELPRGAAGDARRDDEGGA